MTRKKLFKNLNMKRTKMHKTKIPIALQPGNIYDISFDSSLLKQRAQLLSFVLSVDETVENLTGGQRATFITR